MMWDFFSWRGREKMGWGSTRNWGDVEAGTALGGRLSPIA